MSESELTVMVAEYWEKGYTILRNMLSEGEIIQLREDARKVFNNGSLADDLNIRAEARKNIHGNWVIDRLDPVIDLSPSFAAAVLQPELVGLLRRILPGNIQLLKCKLIEKMPGVQGYLTHQDYLYWRWLNSSPEKLCSVAISLHASDRNSGGIELFPNLHHRQIPGKNGSLETDCQLDEREETRSEIPELAAGDALIFHSLTPHRSGPNLSDHARTVLLPSYISDEESNAYLRYYKYEIRRRHIDYVGFERFEQNNSGWQLNSN